MVENAVHFFKDFRLWSIVAASSKHLSSDMDDRIEIQLKTI